MEPLYPDQALAEGICRCAMSGTSWLVFNSHREVVWEIEPDTKVDDDDLTYPVIVHMRPGTLDSNGVALLAESENSRGAS